MEKEMPGKEEFKYFIEGGWELQSSPGLWQVTLVVLDRCCLDLALLGPTGPL